MQQQEVFDLAIELGFIPKADSKLTEVWEWLRTDIGLHVAPLIYRHINEEWHFKVYTSGLSDSTHTFAYGDKVLESDGYATFDLALSHGIHAALLWFKENKLDCLTVLEQRL